MTITHEPTAAAPDLGAICRRIMFVDDATAVLSLHAAYVWNKARTRIRCSGCPAIIDVPAGPDSGDAVAAFARHQAEQLPDPEPPTVPEPEQAAAALEPLPQTTSAEPEQEPALEAAPEPEADPDAAHDEEPAGEPMEQALSEAALATADQAMPKIRRDTKALTATLEEIKKGDRVSATFNHPRYGVFTVEGTVIKGGAGQDRNQLMVAGWHLNLNARATKHLCGLELLAPVGKHEFVIPKPSELNEHVGIG